MRRRWSLPILLVLPAALLLAGCREYFADDLHENEPEVSRRSGEFTYRADLDDYTSSRLYAWDTRVDDAVVDFEGFDFRGQLRVEIFDAASVKIYDRTFHGDGDDEHHVDDTARGQDGVWLVRISATDADGVIWLTID